MKIGTKSLLFGAHQFALHPVCVALSWRRIYGSFPLDPRIWLAFVVHDWGYWGCPNMDGDEGKMHPWFAARWFTYWFDSRLELSAVFQGGEDAAVDRIQATATSVNRRRLGIMREVRSAEVLGPWGRFCLFHSRSLAQRYGEEVSPLCGPDKIAGFMVPRWLYLAGTRWSGELAEYMAEADTASGRVAGIDNSSPEAWFDTVKLYLDDATIQGLEGLELDRAEKAYSLANKIQNLRSLADGQDLHRRAGEEGVDTRPVVC